MTKKLAIDAGHGFHTAGKRTPDGEREWSFNNKVVLAAISELSTYDGVEVLRLDDPTGATDVSLRTRIERANAFKADALVSVHHNANTGSWGTWSGSETYVMEPASKNPGSMALAKAVHPALVGAMGLRDRGVKDANFYVLRESNMPAILTEAGYMDSSVDIKAMRDDAKLEAQGRAIAKGVAEYFNLSKRVVLKEVEKQTVKGETRGVYRIKTGTFSNARSLADAKDQLKAEMKWMVYEVAESTTYNPKYRLVTGTFTTLESAQQAQQALSDKFGWVSYILDETTK